MAEKEELRQAILEFETRREALGDAVVDAALAPLKERLSRLESPDSSDVERKLVTSLFADFAGFTRMVVSTDPEEARELVGSAFAVLVPEIEKFGGTIEKFIGDGVMALFGAPKAHEDDPRRACLAATAMIAALDRFNLTRGSRLRMHFGIGTGIVVAGSFSIAGHLGYSAVGQAVNRAARIAAVAGAGEIYTDAETASLAGADLVFSELPPAKMKGFDEPIRLFALGGKRESRPASGPFLPFVGRDTELTTILEATGEAGPSPTIVVISGEAGIGKTRLAAEYLGEESRRRAAAGAPPPLVLETRCYPYETSCAWRLWSGFLEDMAGIGPADSHGLRVEKLSSRLAGLGLSNPTSRGLLGLADSGGRPGDDEAMDFRLATKADIATSLAELFRSLAGDASLVFVCDDFHFCDGPSASVLVELATGGYPAPSTWLFLTRDPSWRPPEGPGGRAATFLHIGLGPLSGDVVSSLATIRTREGAEGGRETPALAKAGGNPLFIEEMLRQGGEAGSGSGGVDATTTMSPALFSLIVARIDALGPSAREAVHTASVLGDRFPSGLLGALAEPSGLRELLDKEILVTEAEDLSFRHGLLREAVYATLLDRRRRELHARVARAIKDLYPEYAGRRPDVMARHWEGAGEPRKALPHYKAAGEEFFWRRAWREATEYLASGLALAREADSPLHAAEFLAMLGRCRAALGEIDAALPLFDEALAIYRGLSNGRRETAVLRSRAFALSLAGRGEDAEAALREALALAVAADNLKDRAKIEADLAENLRRRGIFETALPLVETALALAETVKELGLYRRLLFSLGDCHAALGHPSEAKAAFLRCAEICGLSGEEKLGALAAERAAGRG